MWTGTTGSKGYGQFRAFPDKPAVGAHTYSYMMAADLKEIPQGILICHNCDNPPCVNPDHLFPGSPRGNVADMIKKGRAAWQKPRTWRRKNEKLTPEQVLEIVSAYTPGLVTHKHLAHRYGVCTATIQHVLSGRTWSGITQIPAPRCMIQGNGS